MAYLPVSSRDGILAHSSAEGNWLQTIWLKNLKRGPKFATETRATRRRLTLPNTELPQAKGPFIIGPFQCGTPYPKGSLR